MTGGEDQDHWFRPKAYGYGAQPANWKGWLATLAFMAVFGLWGLLTLGGTPDRASWLLFFAGVALLTFGFSVFAKSKTKGGWRWRWGK